MSKTKHKYKVDDDYDDEGIASKPIGNRYKQKRLERALKTKNIDELMDLDDDYHDTDPHHGYYPLNEET